jgi:hypothetical protein
MAREQAAWGAESDIYHGPCSSVTPTMCKDLGELRTPEPCLGQQALPAAEMIQSGQRYNS